MCESWDDLMWSYLWKSNDTIDTHHLSPVSSIILLKRIAWRCSEEDFSCKRMRGDAHWTRFLLTLMYVIVLQWSDVGGVNAVRRSSGRRRAGPQCVGHLYSQARCVITLFYSFHSSHHPKWPQMTMSAPMMSSRWILYDVHSCVKGKCQVGCSCLLVCWGLIH